MGFIFEKKEIEGLLVVKPQVFGDDRGFFMETYKVSEFKKNGVDIDFVQDNHSKSSKNTLRGLHYQLNPKAQGKLVRCIKGSILDVAVDIRKNSVTYGKYIKVILSEENKNMFWIPPGFAHGFLSLEDNTEIQYKCTQEYSPENDACILWNDSEIGIDWGIDNPILSEKDKNAPLLKDAKNNY